MKSMVDARNLMNAENILDLWDGDWPKLMAMKFLFHFLLLLRLNINQDRFRIRMEFIQKISGNKIVVVGFWIIFERTILMG